MTTMKMSSLLLFSLMVFILGMNVHRRGHVKAPRNAISIVYCWVSNMGDFVIHMGLRFVVA
ncbi:hypothetical protein IGI04_035900 [Brassica rapa subsp. trilocularis]|uniref:Uncharacterized protein n=1 Tax=Brassica rapa subsp. trilocularis TaxID=1813537 RepID=A0ABQ7LFP3_BRACM|nr:hypothetical protein IGI04_035900 [Brassica rapa subsp. trilocularis]